MPEGCQEEFCPDAILATLRAGGMRITKARRGILEVLFEAKHPMGLTDIQAAVKERCGVEADYATVFRMMTLLAKLRIAHKVNLQKSCSYYELNDPHKHYDHLVCTKCGQVVILDMPCPVGNAESIIEQTSGFKIQSHSLEFFGTCPNCAAT